MSVNYCSQAGIDFIKKFATLNLTPYLEAETLIIGYDHSGPDVDSNPQMVITPQEADELLKKDVITISREINKLVSVELNQNQLDALVSFTLQMGASTLKQTTLLQLINKRKYLEAADQFSYFYLKDMGAPYSLSRCSMNSKSLARRSAERTLFLKSEPEFFYKSVKELSCSQAGIDFIKKFTTLNLTHNLSMDRIVIGYDHPCNNPNQVITPQEAEELLKTDVIAISKKINRLVRVELNQNQFDALVSFSLQMGLSALEGSTLLRLLNNKNYSDAAEQFPRFDFKGAGSTPWLSSANRISDPELIARRNAEQKLFLTPC